MKSRILSIVFIALLAIPVFSENNEEVLDVYIHKLSNKLSEDSGIIDWKGRLWTFNDSGGKNEIYAVDKASGEVVTTVVITNVTNVDWEDITQDKDFIYVGDCGNNHGNRKDLKIYKIAKNNITDSLVQHVESEVIAFDFSEQTDFSKTNKKTRFDCEAIASYGNQLVLFSKDWDRGITTLYVMSKVPGVYSLKAIQRYNVQMFVTGADISSNDRLALIGYFDYKSYLWLFDLHSDNVFANPQKIDLSYLGSAQTEGICFTADGKLLISCEETFKSYRQRVWEVKPQYWQK